MVKSFDSSDFAGNFGQNSLESKNSILKKSAFSAHVTKALFFGYCAAITGLALELQHALI